MSFNFDDKQIKRERERERERERPYNYISMDAFYPENRA